MLTKKAKLEQFDELTRQRGLLERYFWDSRQSAMRPDAKARVRTQGGDVFLFAVYHTDKAHGGYIVVEQGESVPSIEWWETFCLKTQALSYYGEWELAMLRGLEELRHALYTREQERTARVPDIESALQDAGKCGGTDHAA